MSFEFPAHAACKVTLGTDPTITFRANSGFNVADSSRSSAGVAVLALDQGLVANEGIMVATSNTPGLYATIEDTSETTKTVTLKTDAGVATDGTFSVLIFPAPATAGY